MLPRIERPVHRPLRRQEPAEMAEDHDDDAVVEQVRAKPELSRAQQLGRIALPGVRLPVEADQAADEQNREADIRIDAEEKLIDIVRGLHGTVSLSRHGHRARARSPRGTGYRWPTRARSARQRLSTESWLLEPVPVRIVV